MKPDMMQLPEPDYPEPISSGLASLLAGLCYGFVLGIVASVIVRAVL